MDIRVHRILKGSRANGPGCRNVVWFQGCSLKCPGCFNPETHGRSGGYPMAADVLAEALLTGSPNGITISGGEPFQQASGLLALLHCLWEKKSPSVLVFSGYAESELRADPEKAACLDWIDALICGPFLPNAPAAYDRFCSSENQRLVLLTERLKETDFRDLPLSEVIIGEDGDAVISGIFP